MLLAKAPVVTAELPVTGYLDRLSCRPGERLQAMVSLRDGGRFRAALVRLVQLDPNPAGSGIRIEDLSASFGIEADGRRQPIRPGSYAAIPRRPPRPADAAVIWSALVQPTILGPEPKPVLVESADDGAMLTLSVCAEGAIAVLAVGGRRYRAATGVALRPRRWYRVRAGLDPATGRLRVDQEALEPDGIPEDGAGQADVPAGTTLDGPGMVTIAADGTGGFFDGRIEAPAISGADGTILAAWDFSLGIPTQVIHDTGPHRLDGQLHNAPMRGVRGARWRGAEMCWRHAPRDYAAIHFHADDLGGLDWETSFSFDAPADLHSGVYAFRLTATDGAEDYLPFYLLPPRDGPHERILFLAPTFTYQAYANHARGNFDADFRARVASWPGAYPWNPDDFPAYGRSTYNRHADGSGVALSSRLRPMLTMRPGYLTFPEQRGSGLRHFPADSHLTAWLEATGFAFDVATDEDLDREGVDLLKPYGVVLTGSHPEYHTSGTLDALGSYIGSGGRLVYLGGNGFYWRIATSSELPGTIEVRRAEGGIRAWAAEPGEYYHQFDGQYGGLWRRNGRPPQALAGVGFSGQGLFEGSFYRRLPASYAPEHAWIFEGVGGPVIGDHGLSGGGAAGFELDRADPAQGTPPGTVVLARSEGHSDSFVLVPEEQLTHTMTLNGEPPRDLIRAEIVHFETPAGGAVFAVGSITFCGSLLTNGGDNDVSRMLANVVRRFSR